MGIKKVKVRIMCNDFLRTIIKYECRGFALPAGHFRILRYQAVGVHRQHELALYAGQKLKQVVQVFFVKHPGVMPHVAPDIRRVYEMERVRRVIPFYDLERIILLDGTGLQQFLQFVPECIFGIVHVYRPFAPSALAEGERDRWKQSILRYVAVTVND